VAIMGEMAALSLRLFERILRFTLKLPRLTTFRGYNNVPSIRTVNGEFSPQETEVRTWKLERDGLVVRISGLFLHDQLTSDIPDNAIYLKSMFRSTLQFVSP
jgi:hypothetical protein